MFGFKIHNSLFNHLQNIFHLMEVRETYLWIHHSPVKLLHRNINSNGTATARATNGTTCRLDNIYDCRSPIRVASL